MVRVRTLRIGLALVALGILRVAGAFAQNLAPNPSFESGTSTTASSWTPCQASGSAAFSIALSPVHAGMRAARMDVAQSGDTGICSTNITVSANTGYRLSAWLSGPLGRQAGLRVIEWRSDLAVMADKTLASSSSTASGWALLEGSFVTGPSTSFVQIRLMHSVPGTIGTGTFFWDDVTLSPGDPEIRNPSFEIGTSTTADGWARYQNSGSTTFSISTSTVHTGSRSVRMDVAQSGDTGVGSVRFDVLPNQGYSFSAWLKASLGQEATLRVIEWGSDLSVQADKTVAVSSGTTSDWEFLEGVFMSGANTRLVELRLMHSVAGTAGTGTFYWDDVGFAPFSGMFDEARLGTCPVAQSPPACIEASSVNQWTCWQKTLTSPGYVGVNAYRDLELTVEFRNTSTNALVRSGWGFWDCTQNNHANSTEVFRIRTALPPGSYTWETRCKTRSGAPTPPRDCASDKSLNGPTYLAGGTAKGTFTVNTAMANNDRYDRGFLTLSSNRRFLKEGTTTMPFFWLADTVWNAANALRNADWSTYLSSRKQQGFSVLLFGTAPAAAGVSESTAFQALSGCNVDGTPVPNNCSRWMPAYWQQYEAKVQDANANGMVVVVAGVMEPFSYSNPTFGSPQWLSIFGRNLAARLAGHHVIFSPGFDDALTPQAQTLADSVGPAIRQAVPNHLITFHAGGGSRCTDYTGPLQTQTWHDFHLFQSGHCGGHPIIIQPGQEQVCDPLRQYTANPPPPETAEQCVTRRAREMSLTLFNTSNPTKPAVNGEAVYDTDPANPSSPSPENRSLLRQTAYLSTLSGSFGFTYGADYFSQWQVQSSTLKAELGPLPSKPGMVPTPPTAHSAWDIQRMSAIFKMKPWKELIPEPGRILNQQTDSTKAMVYAHTNNYIYNLAYLPSDLSNTTIRLNLSALQPAFACAGSGWTARWIDPQSNRSAIPAIPPTMCMAIGTTAGSFGFTKPVICPTCEWVLSIDRTEALASDQVAASDSILLELWPDPTDGAASLDGQMLDSSGAVVSGVITLSPATSQFFRKQPRVAVDADGSFFTVWESEYQDGSLWGVFGRKLDSQGQPLGTEFQINTYTTGDQGEPAVSTSAAGGAVVAWMSFGQDGDQGGIYAQLYDSSGNPFGSEFCVNSTTAGHQGSPLVGMSDDGSFVVVWESDGQDGDGLGIFAQRFDSSGALLGPEFQVNLSGVGNQVLANLEVDSGGSFVITWYEYDSSDNLLGTASRSFNSTGEAQN